MSVAKIVSKNYEIRPCWPSYNVGLYMNDGNTGNAPIPTVPL